MRLHNAYDSIVIKQGDELVSSIIINDDLLGQNFCQRHLTVRGQIITHRVELLLLARLNHHRSQSISGRRDNTGELERQTRLLGTVLNPISGHHCGGHDRQLRHSLTVWGSKNAHPQNRRHINRLRANVGRILCRRRINGSTLGDDNRSVRQQSPHAARKTV